MERGPYPESQLPDPSAQPAERRHPERLRLGRGGWVFRRGGGLLAALRGAVLRFLRRLARVQSQPDRPPTHTAAPGCVVAAPSLAIGLPSSSRHGRIPKSSRRYWGRLGGAPGDHGFGRAEIPVLSGPAGRNSRRYRVRLGEAPGDIGFGRAELPAIMASDKRNPRWYRVRLGGAPGDIRIGWGPAPGDHGFGRAELPVVSGSVGRNSRRYQDRLG